MDLEPAIPQWGIGRVSNGGHFVEEEERGSQFDTEIHDTFVPFHVTSDQPLSRTEELRRQGPIGS